MATLTTYAQLYKKQEDGSYVSTGWEEQARFEIEDSATFDKLLKKVRGWRGLSVSIERYHVIGHKDSGTYEYRYYPSGWQKVA